MIELKHRCIGVRCPICEKNVIEYVNSFQFASGAMFHCPGCGSPILSISKKSRGDNFSVDCFACGKTHSFRISKKSFFSDNPSSFGCKENKIDILFTGGYQDVDNALFQLSREIENLSDLYYQNLEQTYGRYPAAAIKILEEKAKERRIICLCGSYELSVKMGENGIFIVCTKCGASEFIPAENEDDIEALINRRSILVK